MTSSPPPPRGRSRRLVIGAAVGAPISAVLIAIIVLGNQFRPASITTPSSPPTNSAAALSPTLVPTPTASPIVVVPTPVPTPVLVPAPLTGLPVSPAAALQHPIAVMVDDHKDARPQSGFNAAAIVWQAPAEGGVPRYMLIFQDQVAAGVGPIRSARQYYIEWAAEWSATYVHHGGSPQALDTLRQKGHGQWVWNADGFRWEGTYLWRTDDRAPPHNLFTDGAHLRQMAARVGAKDGAIKPFWSFGATKALALRPRGATLTVRYPYETITYRYDALSNRYVRYIDGAADPQVDAGDGQVVAPTNVVVLRMFFGALNDGHPAKHRLEAHDVGTGVAWIATNGTTVKGTWKKASASAPTLLFGPGGKPITLAAGQTFVQVLALSYGLDVVAGQTPAIRRPGPLMPAID